MAATIKHAFQSLIGDGVDDTLVRPSNWNADHAITGTVDIANGGTGASTSAGAPFALKGANTDLTSVALTSGTVSAVPSAAFDLANKSYVDTLVAGLNFHVAAQYATAAALAANTYNNGTAGVGATLTGNAVGALTVDSNVVVVAQRILVKNEVAGANNGVYVVTTVGSGSVAYVLTRASDYDTVGSSSNQINAGDYIYITAGTVNINTAWVQQTPAPITIGTTSIVFIQFGVTGAGGTNTQVQFNASGVFAGSANLTFNGTTLSANALSLTTALPVASGGTGLTTGTSGGVLAFTAGGVLASSAALTANALVIGGGAGVAPSTTTTAAGALTFLGTPSSANLAALLTDETGTGLAVFATSPALVTPTITTIAETDTIAATAATGTLNYDVITQAVQYFTANASGNWTLNFRGSSSVTLNTFMATGTSVSVTLMVTQGSTAYYNSAVTIDGTSVTPKWQGGTAPTSGNASSLDVYTYVIQKTGSATYVVLASQTKFA
jgi:hypothetical protein